MTNFIHRISTAVAEDLEDLKTFMGHLSCSSLSDMDEVPNDGM